MSEKKLILDACCGSRMFWFDKHNPNTLFIDKRSETVTAKDRDKIRTIEVKPDVIADFTNLWNLQTIHVEMTQTTIDLSPSIVTTAR